MLAYLLRGDRDDAGDAVIPVDDSDGDGDNDDDHDDDNDVTSIHPYPAFTTCPVFRYTLPPADFFLLLEKSNKLPCILAIGYDFCVFVALL